MKKSKYELIPLLEVRILFQVLINVPFLNEEKGNQILKDLMNCVINHWYTQKSIWNGKTILYRIKSLKKLVLFDYEINGSFIKYNDNHIYWDLKISLIMNQNGINKKIRI
ncbi:MAG: hypothetical protein ACFFEY_10615 [Candidatus Thorarchaeota archaeon]